ncbi:hypothetical protein [Neolewinella xylanilytica]|uniref:hypothetical protein n=1 Tax=Neolewinella xylanilytica TaxID=1514080 RepID=UPI0011B0D9E7|nr:hypothetical protein [Neolewinella xylanilytica]
MLLRLFQGYVLLMPLRRLDVVPLFHWLGTSLNITEVLFLVLGPLAVYRAGRDLWPKHDCFTWAAIGLLGVLSCSTVAAGTNRGYLN